MEPQEKIEDDMSQEENASSLSLSITPPLLDNDEKDMDVKSQPKTPPSSDHSISEHLTTNSASSSVENDRSLHEIEITNQPINNVIQSMHYNEDINNISQENKPPSLNTSMKSDSSVISLNYFNQYVNTNGNYHVKGILEEILNDDQFISDKQHNSNGHDKSMDDESLINIFANIDLDDKSLNDKENAMKSIQDYQEIIAIKDNTIAALTNELDSFRELSNSMSTTEYKQLQDELHSKLMEYNSMVMYKDELIRQLTDSLEQGVVERKELLKQIEDFKEKIAELESDQFCNKNAEVSELEQLKKQTEDYQMEIKHLNELLTVQSNSKSLDEMKKELEVKHANEMEELRRYFEKKCADLEKNYSEEVFSQQSRKLSDTSLSSCSEMDLKSEEFGAGGDCTTKKDIELIRNELNTLLPNLNAFNLENVDELKKCEVELKKCSLNLLDKVNTQQLKLTSESKIKEMYENRIKELTEELESLRNVSKQVAIPSGPVQEVASNNSSGDFEITEVVQSYERRLQEQISLAKIDMLNVLENQIQRLVADEAEEEDWPEELLQLRDRFAMKYEQMLEEANRKHEDEINKLKEEHLRVLNGSLGRAKRKSEENLDLDVIKERDLYKKQSTTMRNLLGDLLKYFTQCEDELNTTLVDELLATNVEDESVKRVHLTPNVDELMQLIETNSSFDDSDSNNISIELKNELGMCLEKLKTDANAILSLTTHLIHKPSDDLHKQLARETELKEKLMQEMRTAISVIQTLENDKEEFEKRYEEILQRTNILETELHAAQQRISELIENGQKEVVSEGYGVGQSTHLDDTMKALTDLQETARLTIAESRMSADPKLLHLIEELCNVGEKIKEESLRERKDLLQQVEALENHIQTTTKQFAEQSEKLKLIECERNEAIDKIKVLRDIIRELEQQNDAKIKEIEEFSETVDQLQCIIKQQHTTIAELKQNPLDNISDVHELRKHINKLENELQQLRLSSELAGSEGVIKQFQLQLYELEICLDKKTRDLELLHQSGPNCSTPPSEDMSIRDVIRPKTPTNLNLDECEVPLQQLARLKEKLVRHSRAEEVAMKRTRDMEMQIYNLKSEMDENQHEKECLKKQLQEHLVLISDLQIRLDEQRMRAEHIEKQANTLLETKIYDLKTEIIALQERNQQKDKTINQLNGIINETQRRVKDLEEELDRQPKEDEIIVEMQMEIGKLRMENQKLNEKLIKDSQLVPNLVENIIIDKNCDIEKLQKKLNDTEMELKQYYTLNLSRNEMEKLLDLKKSNSSLYDVLNEVDQIRRQPNYSINESFNIKPRTKPNPNETQFLTEELSSIERIGPERFNYTIEAPLMKPNSTELYKSVEKRVHFEDTDVELLKKQIVLLETQLKEKEVLVNELTDRLQQLNELETKVFGLQDALDQTEKALEEATRQFEVEQKQLQADLVQKKVLIEEHLKRIELLEEDSKRKDEMCLNLAKEKADLEKKVEVKERDDNFLSLDLESAKSDYNNLKKKLNKKREHLHGLEQMQAKQEVIMKQLKEQIKMQNDIIKDRECEIEILNEDAKRYQNDLNDFELKLESLKTEKLNGDKKVNDYSKEIVHLNDLVKEKEKIIQQITEDSAKLHENLVLIKSKMNETGNIVDLANKLRDEQKKNTDLLEEMQNLKVQLLQQNAVNMSESAMDEITGKLKRELDYSVEIDTNILNALSGDPKMLLEKYQQLQNQLTAMDNSYMVKLNEMQSQLEYERFLLQQTQLQDAQLIEQLRLQLDLVMEKQENGKRVLSDSSPTEYREPPTKELLEINQLKEENERLLKKMKLLKQQKQELESSTKYGKKLLSVEMDRSKSLGNKVEELLENQKELRESLLTYKLQLEERIQEVENKKVLMREMEDEKGHLIKQKQQLLDLMKTVHNGDGNNRDLIARSDYLFAKNLKLESVKKALIWQKRYLMAYLMTHREHCLITALPHTRMDSKRLKQFHVNRFRSVVFVVITVLRMKYLVKRWNSETRIAQNVNSRHYRHIKDAAGATSSNTNNLANFHIGQPVSQQNFVQNHWNPFHDENLGDGQQRKNFQLTSSPPTKDTHTALANANLDPLRAPKLLAQFADRFDQIQEKLGIVLEKEDIS